MGSQFPSEIPIELINIITRIRDTSSDLQACGQATYHLFATLLNHFGSLATIRLIPTLSTSLIRLSHERILSYHYKDVPVHWRRLYTDSTLTKIVSLLVLVSSDETEGLGMGREDESVRELDLVIIVAAAPGQDRERFVFDLIERIQKRINEKGQRGMTKKIKLDPISDNVSAKLTSKKEEPPIFHPIPRLDDLPDFDEYLTKLCKAPFIVNGGCQHWRASQVWESKSYLSEIAGPGRVVPVEVGTNYTSKDWGQRIVTFSEFLSSIFDDRNKHEKTETFYLAQHDLFRQFPKLKTDILLPDLIYASPQADDMDYPDYSEPKNEDGYILNAWLGPEGTISPAHTDPFFNCYAQVTGSKWVWVAPPDCSSAMSSFTSESPNPYVEFDSPSSLDADANSDASTPLEGHQHLLTNTSQIDVSSPKSYSRHPRFVKEVLPISQQAILKKGDLLIMPPKWWHSFVGLETSFSVSCWY